MAEIFGGSVGTSVELPHLVRKGNKTFGVQKCSLCKGVPICHQSVEEPEDNLHFLQS